MAEERKHIINIHTATGVNEPSGASLYLGEIAVQHTPENPALWIKVGTSEESDVYEKFIGKTEIMNIVNSSNILGSGYTYSGLPYVNSATTIADAYSALTNELIKDEYTISAAFNDVNDRLTALSGVMQDIDLEPLSASVVTNKTDIATLSGVVADDEMVTSAALNDLNGRIIEVSAATANIPDVSGLETRLTNVETRVSGLSGDNLFIDGYEISSGSSEQELTLNSGDTISEAFGKIQKQVLDDEEAIAASLNDLNSRINTLSGETADLNNDLNSRINTLSGETADLNAAISGVSDSILVLSAVVIDDEEVVAASLNDLNDRIIAVSGGVAGIAEQVSGVLTINLNGEEKGKYSPSGNTTINLSALTEVTGADVLLTGYEISSGTTEEELVIQATDTVNEAFGKLQKQNYDNEEIVSSALNDLDGRIIGLSGAVESNKTDVQNIAVTAVTVSGEGNAITNATYASSALTLTKGNVLTGAKLNNEVKPITNGVVDLGNAVTEMILGSAYTYSGLSYVNSATSIAGAYSALTKELFDVEKVTAAALNDINSRVVELSGNTGQGETDPVYSASIAATITQQDIDNWNAASSGGSSDPIAITGITMNGNAVSVSNRVAALGTVVTEQTQLSKGTATGTGNVVTDINVSDHQITLVKSYSAAPADQFVTLSGAAHNKITALSAATTAHTANTSIHVTTAQTAAWDAKQSSIDDLETIRNNASSGANAYTNMLTGISMNGNNVSITNKVASLGTVVTAQTQLSTATTGTGNVMTDITVNDHQITKNLGMTIPSWATASTKPSYTASEVGAMATSERNNYLPTGTTLDNVPDGTTRKLSDYAAQTDFTAHTASTTMHVSTTEKSTWNGKQDAISDLSTIRNNASSGASAYTGVTALSAATTAMSVNVGKIAVTGVTVTGTGNAVTDATYSNSALTLTKGNVLTAETLTGVSLVGTAVTLSNKVAPIPSASSSTFGVVKTGNFISNNSGTIAVSTGTTNTTVARGDQFLAVSGATTANTSNINTLSGATEAHTATTIASSTSSQMHLPTVSASDNGKILQVVDGQWQLVTPTVVYTGTESPSNTLGNDGDIYLQTS